MGAATHRRTERKANGPQGELQKFIRDDLHQGTRICESYYDRNGTELGHGSNPKPVGKGWTESYKFRDPLQVRLRRKLHLSSESSIFEGALVSANRRPC